MKILRAPNVEEGLVSLLGQAVEAGVFPGAVACMAYTGPEGPSCVLAGAGELEPGGSPVRVRGPYDLASLTKPFVACAALRLAARGTVAIDAQVATWMPELRGTVGGDAPLSALLTHRAGLSSWGALYRELPGLAGSEAARSFMLREAASRPDTALSGGCLYSDFGYLLLGEALARAAKLPLEQLIQQEVTGPLGIEDEVFFAASLSPSERSAWLPAVAPTEHCSFRGRMLRGEVHDENCAAFGGVAGHAGLFGSASGVARLGLAVLAAQGGDFRWLEPERVRWALQSRPGGGYVAGWDTRAREGSSAGSRLSARAFGHLGFTGTSLWCDPDRQLCLVLLSNRVHPTRDNVRIRQFRPVFHDGATELFDAHVSAP